MSAKTGKPVLFQRPADWESMNQTEREAFVNHILDLLGVREDAGPE